MKNGAWTGMDLDRFHALRAFENRRLINERNGILNNNLITSRDFVALLNEFSNNKAEEAKIMKKMEKRMKKKMKMRMKDPKYARLKDKMIIPKSRGYGEVSYPIKELDVIRTDSENEEMQRVFDLKCKEIDELFKREHPEEWENMQLEREHPEEWKKKKEEWKKKKEERRRKKMMKKKMMKKKFKREHPDEWKKEKEFKREHPYEWKLQERNRRSLKMLDKNLRKLKKKWDREDSTNQD